MVALCVCFLGCSDDTNKPTPDGPAPADQLGLPDQALDLGPKCTDGDKRCHGLDWIEVCTAGVWVDTVKCSDKKLGPDPCGCSITLMYVCAVGANICP